MLLAEVSLLSRGAMGELFSVVVAVIYCSAVAGAAGVGTFAVVSYFSPNLEFSFTASSTEHAMKMSPLWWFRLLIPSSLTLPPSSPTSSALLPSS